MVRFCVMLCFSVSVCVCVCAAGQISLSCKPLICSAVNNNRAGITNKVSSLALKRATTVEFLKEAHADKADKSKAPKHSYFQRHKGAKGELKRLK